MLKVGFPQDLKKFENYDLGYSDWFLIDQELINAFAKLSGDDQWIHVDIDRAFNEMPAGKTIAHGYFMISLLPVLSAQTSKINNSSRTINYGSDKIRFINPVQVD